MNKRSRLRPVISVSSPSSSNAATSEFAFWVAQPGSLLSVTDAEDWANVHRLEQLEGVACAATDGLRQEIAVTFPEGYELPRGVGGFRGDEAHPFEEEAEPALPVAVIANALEALVVLAAMTSQVVGEIEERALQNPRLAEQEGHQQAANASVPVEERVDALELCVHERDLDERWQGVVAVQERFQLAERALHLGWWRRDVRCLRE